MTQRKPQRPSHLTRPVPPRIARAVGVVVLVVGLALVGLPLFGLLRGLTASGARAPRPGLIVALAIVFSIGLLCTSVGKRLVAGRSPHGDSLLSRGAWTLVGSVFVALGIGFVWRLPFDSDLVEPLLSSVVLATCCFGVATRPLRP